MLLEIELYKYHKSGVSFTPTECQIKNGLAFDRVLSLHRTDRKSKPKCFSQMLEIILFINAKLLIQQSDLSLGFAFAPTTVLLTRPMFSQVSIHNTY